MKIAFVRTMPHFSMDVYADGLIAGLKSVNPDWEIVELRPRPFDRTTKSPVIRAQKAYERFWRFPQEVQQQTADIFHIVDHSDAHIVRWLKKAGKPVVVTCHDLINLLYPENLQGSVRLPFVSDRLGRYSIEGMEQADAIVAVSSETAKNINKVLNIDPIRITVIPNAVDSLFHPLPEEQAQAFRYELNVSPDTFCLLNVGGNHPRKNLTGILKALERIKQQGLSVQFWKVSDDFTDEDKRFIQANDLKDSIKYLGCLDKNTLVKVYNAADVLVAPSFHEGFGITLLEAMACGTPVITSNVSAMPEVVGGAGILVDPKDSQAIADTVYYLHQNPIYYQELREKGLERIQSFTWEKVAEKISGVYQTGLLHYLRELRK
ncbi:glycosyltransferase family 4 protein [Leptodesmis sichuanensis]|uniref:glycosyltransferase family 4 protein n=1 Tax=Leptodesmis sichuanensis TaxID=2906798 RepID=UPI001F425A99|nr:glycosyltransferase family 1 protein [Leptodesmis sichuanensis]UIE37505.1 glycosyltransferase family 4 protein [Leptodesmis sichuanensis A121]